MNVYISYNCLICFERKSLSSVTFTHRFKKQPKVFVLKNKKTKKLMPFGVWPKKNWLVKNWLLLLNMWTYIFVQVGKILKWKTTNAGMFENWYVNVSAALRDMFQLVWRNTTTYVGVEGRERCLVCECTCRKINKNTDVNGEYFSCVTKRAPSKRWYGTSTVVYCV